MDSVSHQAGDPSKMDLALEQARLAFEGDEVPVGAVVVHEGRVIGVGYNLRETRQSPIAHAEIVAIEQAATALGSWRLVDCDLYVTLEPCPMCLGASQQARIRKVIFGALDPKGGALSHGYDLHKDKRFNHRFEAVYARDPRCEEILREFFKRKRAAKSESGSSPAPSSR
jgi:tRNA(adenine34) deaminase